MRSDSHWMDYALSLARRALGVTWPNPSVGCVLVRDGRLIGYGNTQTGGRPHAETVALERAIMHFGADIVRGATAYVTLEPCSHHGGTPPCAEALVAAGIARAVVALRDPDHRVNGRGVALLRRAGIIVDEGLGQAEAKEINHGFLMRVEQGRPSYTLKLAMSLDGRIALANGESRWITGEEARAQGHALRASHDAILVGIGTALADDPELTCRLPGLATRSPVRIVLDSRGRLPPTSRLAQTAQTTPTWLVTGPAADRAAQASLEAVGVRLLRTAIGPGGVIDLPSLGGVLARLGLTRVLIEGGGAVAANFIAANLVDRIEVFRSGLVLGAEARAAVGELSPASIAAAPRFRTALAHVLGEDLAEGWTHP